MCLLDEVWTTTAKHRRVMEKPSCRRNPIGVKDGYCFSSKLSASIFIIRNNLASCSPQYFLLNMRTQVYPFPSAYYEGALICSQVPSSVVACSPSLLGKVVVAFFRPSSLKETMNGLVLSIKRFMAIKNGFRYRALIIHLWCVCPCTLTRGY
ncbi:hypothetical protein K432DRAFT_156410 [Lepidopterella palustris CBS 459.81]|uniref:Uncharacterized protein n=1 Tax=Lepidopterella palustris CBS 459.81 TaxID=1314670 RepID=A0A8E2JB53_9PEZI|nr:hypothetical protein K432DRAFT_156410 [Lepidopterella palustris CBS 459.81]